MLRIPQNDESDDMGSDIGLTPMESSSITPSRGFKMIMEPRRRRRWYSYILVVILLIVIAFIFHGTVRSPHLQSGSYPIDFLQTLKVQDQNFYNTTSRRDYRQRVLCKLLGDANCQSHYVADVMDLVWVIAPLYCFDPESDWKLYEMHKYFKSYIQNFGLNFITIEAIRFPGDRDKRPWSNEATQYTATVAGNEPYDIQVHYYNVSYLRENLLNVAIRKLDKQRPWEYIFWIDAHQLFENGLWWEESIIKLEKYKALQLFSTLQYIGYDNITKFPEKRPSILRCSLLSTVPVVMPPVDFVIVPGNAWGIRKDVYNAIGTIYDECIGTSCDCAYTLASFPDGITFDPLYVPYYYNFDSWINHTKSIIKGNRGYVSGNIIHMAHGHAFPYGDLQESLNKYNFNATLHLKRDENFTLYITNDTISSGLDQIILKSKHDHPMSRS